MSMDRAQSQRPKLRLVISKPANRSARPSPEIRLAVAATMAEHFRGQWVCAGIGPAGVVDLLRRYVVEVRGFDHPDDIAAIIGEALTRIAEQETTAAAAFRRPPRRRRPRPIRGEQFTLPFGDAA